MPLIKAKCAECGKTQFVFKSELADRLWPQNSGCGPVIWHHQWTEMPPNITTVLATNMFMLEDPQLDSLPSIYELDRQLNIEERERLETEMFQDIRRNL